MAHKEYGVTDIIDILRRARAGDSIRRTATATAEESAYLPMRHFGL